MTEEKRPKQETTYRPQSGTVKTISFTLGKATVRANVEAGWTVLRKREVPFAEMFSVSYLASPQKQRRPLTFVFNGGPGASSAFLHVGALGPRRVTFSSTGELNPPPVALCNNAESWLQFTDLVFVDPVGTGLSRTLDDLRFEKMPPKDETEEKLSAKGEANKEYFTVKQDLDSLGEFIQRTLERLKRWDAPIYIAGESYGGYRVARMVRQLHENYGVPLCGAVLISPALEPNTLSKTDYDPLGWLEAFPSMALASRYHGKSKLLRKNRSLEESREIVEEFARSFLTPILYHGDTISPRLHSEAMDKYAALTGLSTEFITRKSFRVGIVDYSRELLRDEGLVVGLYDASMKGIDPFPDRDTFSGPEASIAGSSAVYAAGVNQLIFSEFGVKTDRRYHLFSSEAYSNWKNDEIKHILQSQWGATDDLRFGMALNPHTKIWISHGIYDLVTPYFLSQRIAGLMKLTPSQREMLQLTRYEGGHMFYSHDIARKQFFKDARSFYL